MLVAATQQWSHVLWSGAETRSKLIPTDSSKNTYNGKYTVKISVPLSINCIIS